MGETHEEKRRKRRKLILRIIFAVVGITGIAVIGLVLFAMSRILNSPICVPSNPDGIQDVAQIKLPPGYTNLASWCGGMRGWAANASFEVDPDNLEIFLASTNVDELERHTELPDEYGSFRSDEVNQLTSFLYGLSNQHEWIEEVIVDTSNPNRWTVYFTLLAG